MTENTTSIQELQDRLQEQIDIINIAIEKIRQDEMVGLAETQIAVESLCTSIESAPPDIARQMAAKMGEMISALETLGMETETFLTRAAEMKEC